MLRFFKIVLLTLVLIKARSQSVSFAGVDSFAISIGKADSLNIAELSRKLTTPFVSPVMKTRAIFTWIAYNISYDCVAFHNKSKIKADPAEVLKLRKAVCNGYTSLFQEMCSFSNIQCLTIDGYARSGAEEFENDPDQPNHTWNAVRINNEWHLVDATWGSGGTDRKVKIFTQELSDSYFFADPKRFLLNHFPVISSWRLCKSNMSKKDFFKGPVICTGYLRFKVNSFTPLNKTIKTGIKKPIDFSFVCDDVNIIRDVRVFVGDEKKEKTFNPEIERSANKINFSIQYDKPGTFPLYIIVNDKLSFIYQLEIVTN